MKVIKTVICIAVLFLVHGGIIGADEIADDDLHVETGRITFRTNDDIPFIVTINVLLCYDKYNEKTGLELQSRINELKDFFRNYFSKKDASYYSEISEEILTANLTEILNNEILEGKINTIIFKQFDMMEY